MSLLTCTLYVQAMSLLLVLQVNGLNIVYGVPNVKTAIIDYLLSDNTDGTSVSGLPPGIGQDRALSIQQQEQMKMDFAVLDSFVVDDIEGTKSRVISSGGELRKRSEVSGYIYTTLRTILKSASLRQRDAIALNLVLNMLQPKLFYYTMNLDLAKAGLIPILPTPTVKPSILDTNTRYLSHVQSTLSRSKDTLNETQYSLSIQKRKDHTSFTVSFIGFVESRFGQDKLRTYKLQTYNYDTTRPTDQINQTSHIDEIKSRLGQESSQICQADYYDDSKPIFSWPSIRENEWTNEQHNWWIHLLEPCLTLIIYYTLLVLSNCASQIFSFLQSGLCNRKLIRPDLMFNSGIQLTYVGDFNFNLLYNNFYKIKVNYLYILFYGIVFFAAANSVKKSITPLSSLVRKQILECSDSDRVDYFTSSYARMKRELSSVKRIQPPNTNSWVYTAAKFAENHNPVLSWALQQQLDQMSPKEFLPYVLNELTLEERESLMIDETQRRKTFLVNWPHSRNRSGINMAQAGFYSLNDYDRVQCVFCRGSLHKWEVDDVPMNEHQKSFPFCRFVKGMECGNRQYRSKKLTDEDLQNITKYGPPSESGLGASGGDSATDSIALGISTNRAANAQYAVNSARRKTFSRWLSTRPVGADAVCDAGFYYTGFDDQVRCFFCSGGLRDWVEDDDPWVEHARWFPDCLYLIHHKGLDYIEKVHETTPANKKSERKTVSQKKADIRKKDSESQQEYMIELVHKLGYSSEHTRIVLNNHGGPFEKVGGMIDALYKLEDSDDCSSSLTRDISELIHSKQTVCPEEDRQKALQQDCVDGVKQTHKNELGCWNCEARTSTFRPASNVALPCGHLVYCDSCNSEQRNKSRDQHHQVICPFKDCRTPLSGTMKVYFA